ncbi:oligosaccharide flippase family protein [Fusobacterium massiliense]|uniref:oligosaccharide flippase family protein n=1 Tax=Fusobacterium massiliense TaxID=1852365 RepID=UPI0028F135B0|nr:oligosaccharide flippase family protein [Fusobacterium massiliense]
MRQIIKKIKFGYKTGFFHIFSSNILNKIMVFAGGIFLVRFLNKQDFGLYSYSQNLLEIFLLINGFGITEGLLQYGSKTRKRIKKEEYVKYSLKIGLLSNIFIFLILILFLIFGKLKIYEAKKILLMMSLLPIFNTFFSIIQIKLRIELKNREMAKISNVNTFLNILGMLIGAYFYGLYGLIIGKYVGIILSIFYSFRYIKYTFIRWKKIEALSQEKKKDIQKFSFIALINNSISQILYIIDIFLIGYLIADKLILASYKIATLIPIALNFIPISVMIYIYPYFAQNSNDTKWIRENYTNLLKYSFFINIFISTILVIFSKNIIRLVFGENYLDAQLPFIILSVGYFFSATLRIPSGNIINAIGKIKFNFYNTLISGIINIVLDIYFIKKIGSIGASYVTLLVFIISGIIGNIFLFKYLYSKNS